MLLGGKVNDLEVHAVDERRGAGLCARDVVEVALGEVPLHRLPSFILSLRRLASLCHLVSGRAVAVDLVEVAQDSDAVAPRVLKVDRRLAVFADDELEALVKPSVATGVAGG